jgi:hypothetical protein
MKKEVLYLSLCTSSLSNFSMLVSMSCLLYDYAWVVCTVSPLLAAIRPACLSGAWVYLIANYNFTVRHLLYPVYIYSVTPHMIS